MHYQKEIWRGQRALTLTEDAMTLRLLPERGGKAASLQWRGVELLAQPRGEAAAEVHYCGRAGRGGGHGGKTGVKRSLSVRMNLFTALVIYAKIKCNTPY